MVRIRIRFSVWSVTGCARIHVRVVLSVVIGIVPFFGNRRIVKFKCIVAAYMCIVSLKTGKFGDDSVTS